MSKTSWIIIGVSAGICLLIGIFLIWPGVSRDWTTYQETKTAQKELEELSQKKQVLGELAKNTNLDTITKTASGYIPEESKSSELILELSAIITESGMSLDQISLENSAAPAVTEEDVPSVTGNSASTTDQSKNTQTAQIVGFSIKITGSFENLMQFFKAVETSSRLIVIKTLGVSQDQKGLSANIQGEAYWNKANTSAEKSLANITVTAETLTKFTNLRQYSVPIDTSVEAGYGRTNPFLEAN